MHSNLLVPSLNEESYCHFCFGGANVHAVFPLGRPDLLSIIDNIIGIHLTPEADETFSLCDGCIATMETFVTFRNKSRSNYETVREAKIMNEAMKRLQPLLQADSFNPIVSSSCTPVNGVQSNSVNTGSEEAQAHLNVTGAVHSTPVRANEPATNGVDGGSSSVRKRSFHPQNTDSVASAKKTKVISDKAAKNKNKFHHIREIMNRLRINRIREKDVLNDGLRSADSFVEKQESISNGFAPLVKQQAEKTHVINCKPCVVVLKRILMDNK